METRTCNRCTNTFTLDENDVSFYAKMKVPTPTVCPDCRFKMRALWRNEMSLYSGQKCGSCGKGIVTMYNPKSPYTVYCNECYRGDSWDPKSYGQDYDFSRPFFDQLRELMIRVPKNALYSTTGAGQNVNSEFTNYMGGLKNCSMCFNTTSTEDSMYCRGITYSTNVFDSYFGIKLDRCYETVNTQNSATTTQAKNAVGCVDCHFIENSSGCTNCFGCINIRNKSYCWLNTQLTREEYLEKLSEVLGSFSKMEAFKKEFEALCMTVPHRDTNNLKVVDSIGDYLSECKNVKYSFEIITGEDCKWNFASREIKDSYGTLGYGIKSELLLEVTATGYASQIIGSWACELSQELQYCLSCFPSDKNLLGCDSMRNSQYFILNKQYTKEEYEKIFNHVVEELTGLGIYGLMLPPELAPFAYNETVGQDNFPMTKEEVLKAGFRWEDDIQMTRGKETMQPQEIPDHIKDVPETILNEVLRCTSCERNYKITAQELQFYQRMLMPIPRQCFYCRHHNRVVRRGPYKFWDRNCAHCGKGITTNYSPERPEIVYCESCYQQEVI
jgi:hypothetical protein